MKVEIRGRQNIPRRGPALLANKHHSESDGIFLAACIPGIAFVAMQELFRYPVIGAILYRLQMIRVDACGGGRSASISPSSPSAPTTAAATSRSIPRAI